MTEETTLKDQAAREAARYLAVLVEPGGHAERIGEGKAGDFRPQGGIRAGGPIFGQQFQGLDGKPVRALGIETEK